MATNVGWQCRPYLTKGTLDALVTTIYTIGYGGRSTDDFVQLLKRYSITHLVDVRTVPQSRYYQDFNRASLEALAPSWGIRYVFLGGQLGGRPDCEECYDINGLVLYDEVRKQHFFQEGLKQIVRGASLAGRCLCLLCSERKPEACHRSKLIGEELVLSGMEVKHISENGEIEDQAKVMRKLDAEQRSLFDEQRTSRKSYKDNRR